MNAGVINRALAGIEEFSAMIWDQVSALINSTLTPIIKVCITGREFSGLTSFFGIHRDLKGC